MNKTGKIMWTIVIVLIVLILLATGNDGPIDIGGRSVRNKHVYSLHN